MKLIACGLITVCVGLSGLKSATADDATSPEEVAEKPNVIFIMADDLGYGDLGCYGQQKIQTPNIDRMAAEGMRFTNCYAGSTVCAPSRCVLMTALHTGHCYIRGNSKWNLRIGDVTVGEVAQKAGYRTGAFGKWGLGHENSGGHPFVQGFHEFYGYLDQHHAHNYYPTFLIRNLERESLTNVVPEEGKYGQGMATEKNEYSHDLIFAEALQFIDNNNDEPFFLYLPFTVPHANNEAGKAGMEIPGYGIYADEDWPEPQKGLAAMITRLDTDIGLLFLKLQEHGLDEKTLVFFTSDNGPHAEGGNDPEFFDSNGPLRGKKRDLYEGGIRVPMIARWPGRIEAGTETDHVSSHVDLMATFGELANAYYPPGFDGVSVAPTLLGDNESQLQHEYLYWEFHEGKFAQAVRMGKWKAIRYLTDNDTVELYDLEEDLGEENDIASKHEALARTLTQVMDEAHKPSREWPIDPAKRPAAPEPRPTPNRN